jgi:hypothetical protein
MYEPEQIGGVGWAVEWLGRLAGEPFERLLGPSTCGKNGLATLAKAGPSYLYAYPRLGQLS